MATFTYKALDARGATASGQIDGDSKAAVAASLRNKGLTVLDINEVKTGLAQTDIFAALQRIKAKDLTVFSRQFATMVNSGLVDAALRCTVLEEQTENKKFAKVLGEVRRRRRGRHRLSDALEKHPKVFRRSTSAWSAPARSAVSSTRSSTASPPSSRRTTASGARSSRRWSTR